MFQHHSLLFRALSGTAKKRSINGQIVAIGDHVSNWLVAEITKDGVRVTSEDQNLWVKPVVNPEAGAQKNRPIFIDEIINSQGVLC